MNETKYFIYWKALKTGATGHGTRSFPYDEAKRYCDSLNEQDKNLQIIHWIEPELLIVPSEDNYQA